MYKITIKQKKEYLKSLENKNFKKIDLNFWSNKDIKKGFVNAIKYNCTEPITEDYILSNMTEDAKCFIFKNHSILKTINKKIEIGKIKTRSKDYVFNNTYCSFNNILEINKNYFITKFSKFIIIE